MSPATGFLAVPGSRALKFRCVAESIDALPATLSMPKGPPRPLPKNTVVAERKRGPYFTVTPFAVVPPGSGLEELGLDEADRLAGLAVVGRCPGHVGGAFTDETLEGQGPGLERGHADESAAIVAVGHWKVDREAVGHPPGDGAEIDVAAVLGVDRPLLGPLQGQREIDSGTLPVQTGRCGRRDVKGADLDAVARYGVVRVSTPLGRELQVEGPEP